MRVRELEGESRFADPSLTHDGGHLANTGVSLAQYAAQMFDLGLASDELRETAQRGCL